MTAVLARGADREVAAALFSWPWAAGATGSKQRHIHVDNVRVPAQRKDRSPLFRACSGGVCRLQPTGTDPATDTAENTEPRAP